MDQPQRHPLDERLLDLIQRRVPLARRPFAQIAAELGSEERAVIQRIEALRRAGLIREISAIFDVQALGYEQALIALRVPEERLDLAGAASAGHPGVSHCYSRSGKYNLWLTLAVSPRSRLGLAGSSEAIARLCGAHDLLVLPTVRRYKLHVHFGQGSAARPPEPAAEPSRAVPDERQMRAIRALQTDLPAQTEPFDALAAGAGMSVDDLLACAADFLADGRMRRYAAVLHHRAAGAAENVLVAWNVADAAADAAGAKCAQLSAVSHCYLRPRRPDWPYNLYTMIHGRSRQDCHLAIEELVAVTGLRDRAELWTLHQYKKQRVRLYGDDEARWEAQHAG